MRKSKIKVKIITAEDHHLLQIEDEVWRISRGYDLTPINSLRMFEDKMVIDRPKDFGGLGKDAIKLERNVPLKVWLFEINALFQKVH